MKIDLSNLKDMGSRKIIKKEIELPDFNFRHQEIETPFPFQLNLDIYSTRDSFILTGDLSGELVLTCSRCLEKFNQDIDIKLEEEILKSEIEDPDHFDLTDIFIENILLAIPIKPICSEDCKGLCPVCGQNLNEDECDCDQEIIDPRLAKLREFFDEDD
ncbi:MAG: hypothetical protein PWR10_131 [Halanaerobiales bacterium]|nr:hypothetical protein [Halanaerobiales bacterium]